MTWQTPWRCTGSVEHVRLGIGVLGADLARDCLEHLALRTHPEVWPVDDVWHPNRYARWDTFPLGLARIAVLAVEHAEIASDPRELLTAVTARVIDYLPDSPEVYGEIHPAVRRWLADSVATLLETTEALRARDDLVPGPRDGWRIVSEADERNVTEMFAWGLAYRSRDARVREFWLLRQKDLNEAAVPTTAAVAATAYVTAFGSRTVAGDKPSYPHQRSEAQDPPAELVRVRMVSAGDGRDRLLWEGTPEQARLAWQPHRPLASALTSGGALKAGRACLSCRARHVCDTLPSAPGLLGLPSYGHQPRALAPSALPTYHLCPTRYALTKIINLPREYRHSTTAMIRGGTVHAWLEQAHGRGVRCSAADLPDPSDGTGEIAAATGVDADTYREGYPYLLQHLPSCPITDDTVAVWPEHDVVAYDTDADVVVSCRPDLLAATAAGLLWRETKTVAWSIEASDLDLLAAFPQVAVAVCLVADHALGHPALERTCTEAAGGPPAAGLVQLELLSRTSSRVACYDAGDDRVVSAARRALAMAAHDWHADETFEARPGAHCQGCEVARWCPSAFATPSSGRRALIDVAGLSVDPSTGEVVAATDPAAASEHPTGQAPRASARQAAIVLSLLGQVEEPGDSDDPAPF